MTRAGFFVLLLAILSPAAACGGDDDSGSEGGPGDPVSPSDAEALCGSFSDHATECGWGGNVNGADWNCGEAAVVWRADVFETFAGCATDLACDGDGATCYQAITGTEPLAIHEEYAATCDERKTACDLTADSDTSTLLLSCNASGLALYASPIVETVIDCFDEECGTVVACLDDVL
jgi:hypothetical protein